MFIELLSYWGFFHEENDTHENQAVTTYLL